MGLVQNNNVITNAKNVAIGGLKVAGMAIGGNVVYKKTIEVVPNWDNELVRVPITATTPSGAIYALDLSADGKYLFCGTTVAPYLHWYKVGINGDLTPLPTPASLPSGKVDTIKVFANGRYVFTGGYRSPGMEYYQINEDDTLTKLANPVGAPTNVRRLDITPDDKYLFLATGDTPYMAKFRIELNNTLTKLSVPTLSTAATNVKISPDGKYVFFNRSSSPYFYSFKIEDNETLTQLAVPTLPGTAQGFGFTSDNKYAFCGIGTTPYVRWFRREDNQTLTGLTAPVAPNATVVDVAATNSSSHVTFAHASGRGSTTYRIEANETLTKVPGIASVGAMSGTSLAITNDDKLMFVGSSTTPFLFCFSSTGGA